MGKVFAILVPACDVSADVSLTKLVLKIVHGCTRVLTGFQSSKLEAQNPQSDFEPFSNPYGSGTNGFLKSFHIGVVSYSLTEAAGTFNVTPAKTTFIKA